MEKLRVEQRVSLKVHCPNPLFEKWLSEWKDFAKQNNSKTYNTYSSALASLKKYPLPLESGKDCKILKGFGNKLCAKLDNALKNHQKNETIPVVDDKDTENIQKAKSSRKRKSIKVADREEKVSRIENNDKEYIPSYRSGPYAILITLYKATLGENYKGFLYKKEIIEIAQQLCDNSFTKSDPGSYYTAWSSMKCLLDKNLVKKESCPAKFSLSDQGILLGHKLYTKKDFSVINKPKSPVKCDKENQSSDNYINTYESEEDYVFDKNIDLPEPVSYVSSELRAITGIYSSDNIQSRETNSSDQVTVIESFILAPNSFDIILYVDTQETSGGQAVEKDPMIKELKRLNVSYEVKNMKVGDYCWICRDKVSGCELIAPYIIERKRMDDLAGSIKDGRFHEQKFRLKQCGVQNVIYVIETFGKKDEHVGFPITSLYQAAVNTLIQDGFSVKFVDGVRGIAEYLSCMSTLIKKNFENKTLVSCPKENLSNISIADDLISLMIFKEFNKLSVKTKTFTVKEMFIRQILQIKGVSVEKALSIVEKYPTLQSLRKEFDGNESKSVNLISGLKYGILNKKIGPVLGRVIYQLLTKETF